MKRILPYLLFVLGAAAGWILVVTWSAGGPDPSDPRVGTAHDRQPGDGAADRENTSREPGGARRAPEPSAVDRDAERRVVPDVPSVAPLSFVVVDSETREPLAGATIHDLMAEEELARCGADGRAQLARDDPLASTPSDLSRLVFGAEGYLLGFFPALTADLRRMRAEAQAGDRIEVRLSPDRYSIPFRVSFVQPDGTPARRVVCRFICVDDPPPNGATLPAAGSGAGGPVDPELRSTWRFHVMAAEAPGFGRAPFHFGAQSDSREIRGLDPADGSGDRGELIVRFVAAGRYRCFARAQGELVLDQVVHVPVAQRGVLTLKLVAGVSVAGIVVDRESGAPIAGVRVSTSPNTTMVGAASTGADGSYRIGPLVQGAVELAFEHEAFEQKRIGPLAPATGLRTELAAKPRRTLGGWVRARSAAGSRPLPGARVSVVGAGDGAATVVTTADGRFELAVPVADAHLRVEAEGFLTWEEIVEPTDGEPGFDLLPADPEGRVAAGLSATIEGRVLGPDGAPRAGLPVAMQAAAPVFPLGIAGRRILRGLSPPDPGYVVCDEGGYYRLECTAPGPVLVFPVDGVTTAEQGRAVQVTLGRVLNDIDLSSRK